MRNVGLSEEVYTALEAVCAPNRRSVDQMAEDILREKLRIGSDDTYLPKDEQLRLDELLRKNTEGSLAPDEERELDRLIALHDECTLHRAEALADGTR